MSSAESEVRRGGGGGDRDRDDGTADDDMCFCGAGMMVVKKRAHFQRPVSEFGLLSKFVCYQRFSLCLKFRPINAIDMKC